MGLLFKGLFNVVSLLYFTYVIMNRLENLSGQMTRNDTKVVEGKNFIKVTDNRTGRGWVR